jgi:hypothetical protein
MDMNTFPILLAAAATTPPPDVPVFGDFAKILDPMFDAARGYSDVLVGAGKVMLSIALVLETMMLTFDYFVKGGSGSDFLHGAFRIFLVALLPATMLATWPELPNAILNLFASQLPAILNGASPGDSGTDHMAHAFSGVLHSMQDIFAPPRLEGKQHWWNLLEKTELAIYKVAAIILLSVPMLIFGFALIITLFGPLFMLYIGVIMAPILVPWMVFKPLANVGMTWVKYMVTMGVAFVIGLVMAGIVMTSVQDYASVVNGQSDTLGSFAALIFGLFPQMIMLLFLAYMMIKVEQIAAAMVGGGSIGGGGAMAAMMGAALAKGGGGKDGKAGGTGGDAKGASGGADKSGGTQQAGQGKSAATDQASLSKGAAEAGAVGTTKGSAGGSQSGLSRTAGDASTTVPAKGGDGGSQSGLSRGAGEAGASGSPSSGDGTASIWLGESEGAAGASGSPASGKAVAPVDPSMAGGGVDGGSAETGIGGGQKESEVGVSGKGADGSGSRFGPGAKRAAKTAGKIAVAAALPPVGMAMAAYSMSPRIRRMTDSGVSKVKSGAQAVADLAMPKKADKSDAPQE